MDGHGCDEPAIFTVADGVSFSFGGVWRRVLDSNALPFANSGADPHSDPHPRSDPYPNSDAFCISAHIRFHARS